MTNDLFINDIKKFSPSSKILKNPQPEHGMLSSVLIGLREIESSCFGFFLCPIDYPLVQQKTYQKLLLAHHADPNRIIKPSIENRTGHPIIFPQNLFQPLHEAPLQEGARFVTRRYAHLLKTAEVDDPGIFININTPELYYKHCK